MGRLVAILALLALLLGLPATAAAALPGDEPSTAIPASLGTTQYDSTNMTANPSVDPKSCGVFEDFSNTMWFSYTPTTTTQTQFDVNSFVSPDGSTDFLAIIIVLAQHGSSLDVVACDAFPATVRFRAEAGTTYLIMSGGLGADDVDAPPELTDRGGTFDLTITTTHGQLLADRFHDSDTFVDDGLSADCGFQVTVSFDDSGVNKTFFSSSGARMATGFVNGMTTFTTEGGRVLSLTYASTFRNLQFTEFIQVGVTVKVRLDGKLISVDAGRLVFDEHFNLAVEHGQHPVFFDGLDICGLLAS
jgi:hypothetical protein